MQGLIYGWLCCITQARVESVFIDEEHLNNRPISSLRSLPWRFIAGPSHLQQDSELCTGMFNPTQWSFDVSHLALLSILNEYVNYYLFFILIKIQPQIKGLRWSMSSLTNTKRYFAVFTDSIVLFALFAVQLAVQTSQRSIC